jgi:hypothetical protein
MILKIMSKGASCYANSDELSFSQLNLAAANASERSSYVFLKLTLRLSIFKLVFEGLTYDN